MVPAFRFIIDGAITLPIALYGFLVFPDLPKTTKAFYLTEEVGRILSPCGIKYPAHAYLNADH